MWESGDSAEGMGIVSCGAEDRSVEMGDGAGCDRVVPSNLATSAFVLPTVLYEARTAGAGVDALRLCFSDRSKVASGAALVGETGPAVENREKNLFMVGSGNQLARWTDSLARSDT